MKAKARKARKVQQWKTNNEKLDQQKSHVIINHPPSSIPKGCHVNKKRSRKNKLLINQCNGKRINKNGKDQNTLQINKNYAVCICVPDYYNSPYERHQFEFLHICSYHIPQQLH